MFHYFRVPSGGAQLAIGYITLGVLMVVWSIVWLAYLMSNGAPDTNIYYYIIAGLVSTGIALMAIGILMGRIGSEARNADAAVPAMAAPLDGNAAEAGHAAAPQAAMPAVMPAAAAPAAMPAAAPAAMPAVPASPTVGR